MRKDPTGRRRRDHPLLARAGTAACGPIVFLGFWSYRTWCGRSPGRTTGNARGRAIARRCCCCWPTSSGRLVAPGGCRWASWSR
ncbi:hypothetical protein HBB16_21555 [Pseudonocardia sp. MCCB 268]|nr:hypothetical protein [Pseudonocardia cytotoxica]